VPAAYKRGLAVAAGLFAFILAVAYVDLVLRARSAYLEGEKYLAWNEKPELKAAYFDAQLAEKETELKAQQAKGKLTAEELADRLELAKFERDERVAESSLKYAYTWFQTAVELFSPPESKWVKLSREKLGPVKEMWKAELRAKKIPFQDYMLE
jgi:hypothetical protein